ncbi:MAG: hypothetical protein WCW34_05370, partial [Patescibacteria group bacterium]
MKAANQKRLVKIWRDENTNFGFWSTQGVGLFISVKSKKLKVKSESRKAGFLRRVVCAGMLTLATFSSLLVTSYSLLVPEAKAASGISHVINYQGRLLKSPGGVNVHDATYEITFRLYNQATGGSQLWSASTTNGLPTGTAASVNVTVQNGLFSVLLGDASNGQVAFPADLFNSDTLYLGVKVGSDNEMTPRKRLSSVPYAYNSETLQGQYASNTVANTGGNLFALNQNSNDAAVAKRTAFYVHTSGTSNVYDYLLRANSGSDVFTINRQGNVTTTGNLQVDGYTLLGASSSNLVNFRARIASDLIPSVDTTYSLGSAALRWKNLFVTNVSSTNIDATGYVSTTQLWVNGSQVISANPNLQQVTNQGYVTTNPIRVNGVSSTASILPTANNAYDLGSSTKAWQNVYASGTYYGGTGVNIVRPTAVSNGEYAFYLSGTAAASPASVIQLSRIDFTGAGSKTLSQTAQGVYVYAGYTGGAGSRAQYLYNASAATGTRFDLGYGNYGGLAYVAGSHNYWNVGYAGIARDGLSNFGLVGNATTNKNGGTNIGVTGLGLNGGSTPVQIGGYFALRGGATPNIPTLSAALIADNGAETSPIMRLQDNGTDVMTVVDGGNVGFGTANPYLFKLTVAGTIAPSTTNSYDLGSSSYYWRHLFVTNVSSTNIDATGYVSTTNLYLSGTSISGLYHKQGGNAFNTTSTIGTTDAKNVTFVTGGTSKMTILSGGSVGIGTVNPGATLDVTHTATDASSYTLNSNLIKQATTNGSNYNFGVTSNIQFHINSGITDGGSTLGFFSYPLRELSDDQGTLNEMQAYGTSIGHYGATSRVTNNVYGYKMLPYAQGGTIGNMYGLYIGAINGAGTVNNKYGVYVADTNMKNIFMGNTGIGTNNPYLFKLTVAGTIAPSTTNSYDLGASAYYWRNLFVTNVSSTNLDATGYVSTTQLWVNGSQVISANPNLQQVTDQGYVTNHAIGVAGVSSTEVISTMGIYSTGTNTFANLNGAAIFATSTSGYGLWSVSHSGIGIYGDSYSSFGGYFRSYNGGTGLLAKQGSTVDYLTATSTNPTIWAYRSGKLGQKDFTAPVLLVEDAIGWSGDLQNWKRTGNILLRVDNTGTLKPATTNSLDLGTASLSFRSVYVSSTSYLADVNAGGNVIPRTTLSYDLGSSSNYWRKLFVTNVSSTNIDALGYVSTTNLWVNGSQVISANPNLQQVTDQGYVTTNPIRVNGVSSTASILPTASNAYDLGSISKAWKDFYASGTIRLANTVDANTGVIYKSGSSFIHNFKAAGSSGANTFVGENSGNFTMSPGGGGAWLASYNTAIGYETLKLNTTGMGNAAIGNQALTTNSSGFYNSAIGTYALYSNTSGANNTALGYASLMLNSIGSQNVAIGSGVMFSNTFGNNNLAAGMGALSSNSTGNANVGLGYRSMYYSTTGSSSTAVGYESGVGDGTNVNYRSVNDTYMVFLGHNASKNSASTLTNGIAIGYDAKVLASNQAVLGNDSITTTLLKGNVGLGTNNPYLFKLTVAGTIAPSTTNSYDLGASAYYWRKLFVTNVSSTAIDAVGYVSTTKLWVHGSEVIAANPNLQQVTNQGYVTTNPIRVNGVSSTADILPTTNNSYDLGSLSYNWRRLYATNVSSTSLSTNNANINGTLILASSTVAGLGTIYQNNASLLSTLTPTSVSAYPSLGNLFLGYKAGTFDQGTNGWGNVAVGPFALSQPSGNGAYQNTAIGNIALLFNVDGYNNTGVGAGSLLSNVSGYSNAAVGMWSLVGNVTGDHNAALGEYTMGDLVAGDYNLVVGGHSGTQGTGPYTSNITQVGGLTDALSTSYFPGKYGSAGGSMDTGIYYYYLSYTLNGEEVPASGQIVGVVEAGEGSIVFNDLPNYSGPLTYTGRTLYRSLKLTADISGNYPASALLYKVADLPNVGSSYTDTDSDATISANPRSTTDPSGSIALGYGANYILGKTMAVGSFTSPIYDAYFGESVYPTDGSTPHSFTLHASGGNGTDKIGADLILAGGNGTGSGAGGALRFQTSPTSGSGSSWNALQDRMVIKSDGSVGIGTSNPYLFKLTVAGTIAPSTTNSYDLGSSSYYWRHLFVTNVSSTNIDATGYVSTTNLYLSGTSISGLYHKQGGNAFGTTSTIGTTDNNDLILKTNNASRMTVLRGGNVGIGTTNPLTAFHIKGSYPFLLFEDTSSPSFMAFRGDARMFFDSNSTYVIASQSNANKGTATGEINRLSIKGSTGGIYASGTIMSGGLVTYGNANPGTTNLYDLGTSSLYWRKLFATNVSSSRVDALSYVSTTNLYVSGLYANDVLGIPAAAKNPTGFTNRTDSIFLWDDASRTFSIGVKSSATSYTYYISGLKYTKSSTSTVTIPNTEGVWYFYFVAGTLTASQTQPEYGDYPMISNGYWSVTQQKLITFAEERHGITMDPATHEYLHHTVGTRYSSGLTLTGTTGGTGNANGDAQVALTNGTIYDEDADHNITNSTAGGLFQQILSPTSSIPVYYRKGSASDNWEKKTATYYPVYDNSGARLSYNLLTGNTWSTSTVTNADFVAMWIFATNNVHEPVIAILGQRDDGTLANAQANNTYNTLSFGNLPFQEMKVLYRLIYQTATAYNNPVKARLREIQDLRSVSNLPAGTYVATSHSSLTGLLNDDHTQYLLLAGRTTGQVANGGIDAGGNLTLDSTADVTKGTIYLQPTSGAVQIGTTAAQSIFSLMVNGHVGPSSTNAYDLGSSSYYWRRLYATNVSTTRIDAAGYVSSTNIFANRQVLTAAGSQAVPGISFGVTNTGLWSAGATDMRMSLAGVTKYGWNTTMLYPASNNALDLGGYGYAWRNLYVSSTSYLADINAGGTITPRTTLSYDLGSSTNYWRKLFVTNVSSTNIDAVGYVSTTNLYLAGTSISGLYHKQGGNAFNTTSTIGTTDANNVTFVTGG